MARKAKIARKTSETDIVVEIDLDGEGKQNISTSIPFLDHMLSLFSKHGLFDLKVKAKGISRSTTITRWRMWGYASATP